MILKCCVLTICLIIWPLVFLAWSDFVVVCVSPCSQISAITLVGKMRDKQSQFWFFPLPYSVFTVYQQFTSSYELGACKQKKRGQQKHQAEQNLRHFLTSNHYWVLCINKDSCYHFHHFHDAVEMYSKPLT